MLRQYELVERVKAYDPDADEALLNRAYVFTVQKHGTQKRASGDPYFSHPIEVAGLMTDLKLDQETIVTALLHDTVEDTLATIEEVEKTFGPDMPSGDVVPSCPYRAATTTSASARTCASSCGDERGHRSFWSRYPTASQHAHAALHQEPR